MSFVNIKPKRSTAAYV